MELKKQSLSTKINQLKSLGSTISDIITTIDKYVLAKVKQCPQKHLIVEETVAGTFERHLCDRCRVTLGKFSGETFLRCSQCDYDVCMSCYDRVRSNQAPLKLFLSKIELESSPDALYIQPCKDSLYPLYRIRKYKFFSRGYRYAFQQKPTANGAWDYLGPMRPKSGWGSAKDFWRLLERNTSDDNVIAHGQIHWSNPDPSVEDSSE